MKFTEDSLNALARTTTKIAIGYYLDTRRRMPTDDELIAFNAGYVFGTQNAINNLK